MEKRIVAQVSAETLRLQALIDELSAGDKISYPEIEQRAGVKMDLSGRAKLRVAVKRAGRVSDCIVGWGIEMASAKTVLPILGRRVRMIDGAVRRADRCQSKLHTEFFASLPVENQQRLLFCGAVFGLIQVAADNFRFLYAKKGSNLPSQTMMSLPLPKQA